MTPASEQIILDRATHMVDKSRPIDTETLQGLQEILLTSRKERAEEISLLMSLIGYRRAGYRASKSIDERDTAYRMGIVDGMCRMAKALDAIGIEVDK